MRLRKRYRRLSLWNKFGFWAGLASIIGLAVTLAVMFLPMGPSPTMIGLLTGGDNYAYVDATVDRNPYPNVLEPEVIWFGKYPLRRLTMTVVGTHTFVGDDSVHPPNPFRDPIPFGDLPPGPASIPLPRIPLLYDRLHFSITFSGLNGTWRQNLFFIQVRDRWLKKSVVFQWVDWGVPDRILYQSEDPGFPANEDFHVDSMRRIYPASPASPTP